MRWAGLRKKTGLFVFANKMDLLGGPLDQIKWIIVSIFLYLCKAYSVKWET